MTPNDDETTRVHNPAYDVTGNPPQGHISTIPASHEQPSPPCDVPGYEILEELGRGGMGVVYKARHVGLNRLVALKMIRAGGCASAGEILRFKTEGETIARLNHPSVVQVHEIGVHNGSPYLALEFCSGGNLAEKLAGAVLPPREAGELLATLSRAAHAAHEAGVVHRDLKPQNVLLTGDGTPKVADFGLAKWTDSGDGLTATGEVFGTPSYMAPEQASGQTKLIDERTDVYALGGILYACLTGRPPFKGATPMETMLQVLTHEPAAVRTLQPGVPLDLDTICAKCLQKSASQRYPTAAALADDLRRFLDGVPIAARPVGRLERFGRWAKRKPALAGLLGVSVLAVAAILAGAFWFTYELAARDGQIQVAEERNKTISGQIELAEEHTKVIASQKEAAELRQAAEKDRADAQAYYAALSRARETITDARPGWTRRAQDELRTAALAPTTDRQPAAIRSALVASLAGTDLREPRLIGSGFPGRVLAFHPKQPIIAVGQSSSGRLVPSLAVKLFNTTTGELVRTYSYTPHAIPDDFRMSDATNSIAFSGDGQWLAVGTRSGWIHLWDTGAAQPMTQSWKCGIEGRCNRLAFAKDSSALISMCGMDQKYRLERWQVPAGKPVAHFTPALDCDDFAPTPDGRSLVVGHHETGINRLVLLDSATLVPSGVDFTVPHRGRYAISPGGELAACVAGQQLALYDLANRMSVRELRDGESASSSVIMHVAISPCGRLLATSSEAEGRVKLWDLAGGRVVADYRVGLGYAAVAFDPTGRRMGVTTNDGVALFDVEGMSEIQPCAVRPAPTLALALSHRGQSLTTVTRVNLETPGAPRVVTTWLLDTATPPRPQNALDTAMTWGADFASVSHSPRDGRITVGIASHREFRIWEYAEAGTHIEPRTWALRELHRVRYGGDGRLWIVYDWNVATPTSADDAGLLVWRNLTGNLSGLPNMTSLGVGERLALVGGRDGAARLFSSEIPAGAKTLSTRASWTVENRVPLRTSAVAPDDSLGLLGSESGTAYLLRLPQGEVLARWKPHGDSVTASAFLSPTLFVTGSRDRTLRFWQWTGGEPKELFSHRGTTGVSELSFAGHRLAVLHEGEWGVRVWDLAAINRRFAEFDARIDHAEWPKQK